MLYLWELLIGFIGGGICVFIVMETWFRKLREVRQSLVNEKSQAFRVQSDIDVKLENLRLREQRLEDVRVEYEKALKLQRAATLKEIEEQKTQLDVLRAEQEREMAFQHAAKFKDVDEREKRLGILQAEFDSKVVTYQELREENSLLKRDLHNIGVNLRKSSLDQHLQRQAHEEFNQKLQEICTRYLKDNVKWISSSLSPSNYAACKERLLDVVERCRSAKFDITSDQANSLVADLKREFERVVRASLEREEQARIKAQIREEQLREREVERELKQLDREREAINTALEKALSEASDMYSAEVEHLRSRLAEAEAKSQRAISQAQLTKTGNVYVISNVGSFGEGIYKVGMTRRLEPVDRIRELSDASVPFPFDVHMMISCDDAPSLENALHRGLHKMRINKVNLRKEFFKVELQTILEIVKKHHGYVEHIADAEAWSIAIV